MWSNGLSCLLYYFRHEHAVRRFMRQFAQHFSSLFQSVKWPFPWFGGKPEKRNEVGNLVEPKCRRRARFYFCNIFLHYRLPTTISEVEARFHSAIVSYIVPNVATCCQYISIRHGWGLGSGLHAEICHTILFFFYSVGSIIHKCGNLGQNIWGLTAMSWHPFRHLE